MNRVPPIAVTRSGALVHLTKIRDVKNIRIGDIADHLAKINRYAGATQLPFSVAQHSELVAEQIAAGVTGARGGIYGLLHDAHEAYIGDISEPALTALAEDCAGVREALAALRARLDARIHAALGLVFPPEAPIAEALTRAHDAVSAAERRDLLTGFPAEPAGRSVRRLRPYSGWAVAAEQWTRALDRYAAVAGIGHIDI